MTDGQSAVGLVRAGIYALAHVDAAQLEELAEAARRARRPETVAEQVKARELLRTLQLLIAMTLRNLRLLRGASCHSYGPSGV